MRRTRGIATCAIAAGAVLAALAATGPALAHPGHTSCEGFGQEHAFFARELGGLGAYARDAGPLADEAELEHELFCTPR